MLARNAYRAPDRRGGGPHGGRNNCQVRRYGPGRFGVRRFQARKNDRHNGAAQKGNTGKLGARPDPVVLTYCEKGSSTLMKYLKDFVQGIRLICGFIFGTLFDFERPGNPPDFKPTELITQELGDELEPEHIQTNIDDRSIEEETRMELRAAIEVIRDSHNSRSASAVEVLNKRRLGS
jgi:hypothetical protein